MMSFSIVTLLVFVCEASGGLSAIMLSAQNVRTLICSGFNAALRHR
jgi:hypothetical protein